MFDLAASRHALKHNGKATQARYVNDEAGHILVEQTISGSTTTTSEIVWMDNLPLGLIRDNVLHYIEPDHLGTPRQVIDRTRNVAIWRWDLINDPFGESAPNTNPDADATQFVFNLRFPGQLYDAESALNYNYFRDYEPGTGRYVESDPIGLRGGFSTFGYVAGRPLRHRDPLGLQPDWLNDGSSMWDWFEWDICSSVPALCNESADPGVTVSGQLGGQVVVMGGWLGFTVGGGHGWEMCGSSCWYVKICGLVGEGGFAGIMTDVSAGIGGFSDGSGTSGSFGGMWGGGAVGAVSGDFEVSSSGFSGGIPLPTNFGAGVGEFWAGKGCWTGTICRE